MRLFTVAGREFRSGARQPWTHRIRWLTATLFFVLLLWLLWVHDVLKFGGSAYRVFESLSNITLVYCLLIAAARSSDAISSERREGTLGLLYLTELNSLEIVAGKVATNAVATGYGLMAIFPLMALPILMGGIQFSHFWKVVLSLLNSMWLGTAFGFAASVLCTRQFPAVGIAFSLSLSALLGIPLLSWGLHEVFFPNPFCAGLAGFSPYYSIEWADINRRTYGTNNYWTSFLSIHLLGWTTFLWVAWRLSRSWRDAESRPALIRRLTDKTSRQNSGQAAWKNRFRARLLDINPFLWLGGRARFSSPLVFGILVIMVLFTTLVACHYAGRKMGGGQLEPFIGHMFCWFILSCILQTVMGYHAAACASQRLAEDKQTGALELILCTPIGDRRIFSGLWLAYARALFAPGLLTLLCHFFLMWHVATAFMLERHGMSPDLPKSAGAIIWMALTTSIPGSIYHQEWVPYFMLRVLFLAMILLAANWVALGWVGRWLGLRMKHTGFAPIASLALMTIPPWIAFAVLCYFLDEFGPRQIPESRLLPAMLWVAAGFALGYTAIASLWARERMQSYFRPLVVGRFDGVTPVKFWRPSLKFVIRTAIFLAFLPVLGSLLLAWQTSNEKSSWLRTRERVEGSNADKPIQALLPPPPKSETDFSQSTAYANFQGASSHKLISKSRIQGVFQSRIGGGGLGEGWIQAKHSDYTNQFAIFAELGRQPTASRTVNASNLLNVISQIDPQLDLVLQELRNRTNFLSSFQNGHESVIGAGSDRLDTLGQMQLFLQMRAGAQMELGRSDLAYENILGCLKLAALAAKSADRTAPFVTQAMICHSIQPIWEGLASDAFTPAQLQTIQEMLLSFDLPALYRASVIRIGRACSDQLTTGRHRFTAFTPWIYTQASMVYDATERAVKNLDQGNFLGSQQWSSIHQTGIDHYAASVLAQWQWNADSPTSLAFSIACQKMAALACALQRHQARHGRYPENLEDLLPEFLQTMPLDPSRNARFHYQRLGDRNLEIRGAGMNQAFELKSPRLDDWIWRYPSAQ